MIEVIFKCNHCGSNKGQILTCDRTTEIECEDCSIWHTVPELTTSKCYVELIEGGKLPLGKERDY